MALDYSSPDWEDEQLQRQIAFANKLRQQSLESGGEMRGRIYVKKDPLENFVQGFAGSMLEGRATGRQQSRQQADEEALRNWANRTPEMTEGMTPRQLADLQRRHAQEGLMLRSPLARSLAVKGYDYAMTAPERQAAADAAAQARQDQIDAQAAARAEQQARDLEYKKQRDADIAQQKIDADERERSLRMTLAAMNNSRKADAAAAEEKQKTATQTAKEQQRAEAKSNALRTVDAIDETIDELEANQGVVSPKFRSLTNVGTALSTIPAVQMAQRGLGTKNQANRDLLQSRRVQLLTELKNAKGLSASEMNSNFEFQKRLDALGGNNMNVDTLREIMDDMRETFGGQRKRQRKGAAPAPAAAPNADDELINKYLPKGQ